MIKEWGFVLKPPLKRTAVLIGYPFNFKIPVPPPVPVVITDLPYLRLYLNDSDAISINQVVAQTRVVPTSNDLIYLRSYLNDSNAIVISPLLTAPQVPVSQDLAYLRQYLNDK